MCTRALTGRDWSSHGQDGAVPAAEAVGAFAAGASAAASVRADTSAATLPNSRVPGIEIGFMSGLRSLLRRFMRAPDP